MQGMNIDETDGVKIIYDDAWVLVRPSGTEPIYRIFAEAKDESRAKELSEESSKTISEIIKDMDNSNS